MHIRQATRSLRQGGDHDGRHFNENDLSHVVEADRAHVWHHLIQHKPFETTDPRIIVEGKGMRVWDQQGQRAYRCRLGRCLDRECRLWPRAHCQRGPRPADQDELFRGAAGSIPGAIFAEKLIDKMPGMSRVYYMNSGSEANEKAFKMVRQIAHKRYGGKKHKILYRDRDYHGTTIAACPRAARTSATRNTAPSRPASCACRIAWNTARTNKTAPGRELRHGPPTQIEEVILREGPDTVGALCLEPVTAGGGVITPPEGYWERVQEICKKYDVLLHIDEVVCGVGRTGTWFGYQHYGIKPDMVTMAKGVASGYAAIACLVTTERCLTCSRTTPATR